MSAVRTFVQCHDGSRPHNTMANIRTNKTILLCRVRAVAQLEDLRWRSGRVLALEICSASGYVKLG